VGPGSDVEIPVDVDYGRAFEATDWDLWQEEYLANVRKPPEPVEEPRKREHELLVKQEDDMLCDPWWRDPWGEYADFDRLEMEDHYDIIH
jgi:hypothetical protein